jgi:hypothetical protein
MTFAAIPIKRCHTKGNKPANYDFVAPVIPAGGFVQGFVGNHKDCLKWLQRMMIDYSGIKELIGFSSSPKFLWDMSYANEHPYPTSYAGRILFGYPHDIMNEDVDVCWVKIHFASEVAE